MANYRKSFNFRTGLQVDNDNFVVNANGLVGIGTSTPENYLLNVYGDTRVTGVTTTANLIAGVGTVSTLTANSSSLGVASVTSIQIAGGPVLTNLVGYAYSTFIDDAVGGISTTSRIGIGTTADTGAKLKVLGDSIFTGNIDASTGIVTASSFVGDITGTVTGTATTANNLSDGANITTGTISNDRLPTNINKPTGIVTASSFVGDITGTVTGTATTATNLSDGANITTGTIDDARLPDLITSNINISSGISTVNQVIVGSSVTIDSSGINIPSGIVTATTFVGDVTGTATTANNLSDGSNITTGTISDARLPDLITSNIDITSGISTFNDLIASNANLTGGIVTATTFIGSLTGTATTANNLSDGSNITTGTISDARLPDLITSNINISSGISTVSEIVVGSAVTINSGGINASSGIVTATTFVGSLTGTATTATALSGTPDIGVGIATASSLSVSGIITSTTEINVGTDGSGVTALSTGNIGIGTTNPTSELLIRKTSGSLLQVVSDSGEARISIGNSVDAGNSSGVLRFGNTQRTLDFINRDTGNINMFLHAGGAGINTGRFDWLYGQTNVELMSLTYGGSLGIGITNPSNTLHVVGTSTVTGNAWVGGNLSVDGNISGTITLPTLIESNINVTSGISTFNNVVVDSSLIVSTGSSIGLGTDNPIQDIDAQSSTALVQSVGIGTTNLYGGVVGAYGNVVINGGLGINTDYFDPSGATLQIFAPLTDVNSHLNLKQSGTAGFNTADPRAIVDFGNVGSATTRPVIVVPNINNTTITGIAETPAGSIIFNTTTSKFQGYTGIAWTDLH